jgi:hypothetical protein
MYRAILGNATCEESEGVDGTTTEDLAEAAGWTANAA